MRLKLHWTLAALLGLALGAPVLAQKMSTPPDAFLKDVNSLAGVSRLGSTLLTADGERKRWGDYCTASRALSADGKFREAIRMASRALYIGQGFGSSGAATIYATNDIAIAYSFAGDAAQANEWAERSLSTIALNKFDRDNARDVALIKANALRIRAQYLSGIGKHEDALTAMQRSLEALPGDTQPRVRAELSLALAATQLRAGQADKAREVALQVSNGSDPVLKRGALRLQGEIALARKDGAGAVQAFAAAAEVPGEVGYQALMIQLGLARAHRLQGQDDAAAQALDRGLAGLENLRSAFQSFEMRTSLLGNLQDVFDEAVDFHSRRGDWARALAASEGGRARAMLDLQGKVTLKEGQTAPAVRPLALTAIQARLGPQQTLVVYHQLPERLIVWAVQRDSLQGQVVPVTAATVRTAVAALRSGIEGESSAVASQAQALHQQLLAPLALAPGRELIFVPHKSLHLLPFQALHDGRQWLIQAHPVSTALSASLFEAGPRPQTALRLAALGNPDLGRAEWALPGAEAEVRAIEPMYPQAGVYVQKEASKARLTEVAPGAGVLHVAAHAVVDEIDPMYSMIKLATLGKALGTDMEAREFAALDLSQAQLVSLSACNSGVGKVAQGDEFMGFKRALFSAGARSILVSLWPVDDESTRLLMTDFHQAWKSQSRARAMQQAQLKVLADPRFASPFYWAAFTLVGDPG